MKKLNIYILCAIGFLSLVTTTSCEEWFDVDPRTEIKEDDLFKDESGYFDALVGVYSIMGRQALYGDNLTMGIPEAIVQNYYLATTAHPLNYAKSFDYENTNLRPTIDSFWSGLYEAIVNDNNVLEHLAGADRRMFSDNNYELIRGEALALRAYLHFDALRLFGPSFRMDPDRKCIPYVTAVSRMNTPYSSAREVVELCIRDLKEAEQLLADDPVINVVSNEDNIYRMNRTTRMNLFAVRALMARIYHYAGDKANALAYARMIIDSDRFNLISNMMTMTADRVISAELLFALFVDNLSDWADDHFSHSSYGYDYQQMTFYLDDFFDVNAGLGKDIRYEAQFDVADYYGKLNKYLSKNGDSYNARYRVPMLRLSEMFYIAAESTSDLDEATTWLNQVRRARSLEAKSFSRFDDIETYLTAEYRREFYGEGQLFYRYKWLDADVIGPGYLAQNVSARKEKVYILPLPDQEQEFGNTALNN